MKKEDIRLKQMIMVFYLFSLHKKVLIKEQTNKKLLSNVAVDSVKDCGRWSFIERDNEIHFKIDFLCCFVFLDSLHKKNPPFIECMWQRFYISSWFPSLLCESRAWKIFINSDHENYIDEHENCVLMMITAVIKLYIFHFFFLLICSCCPILYSNSHLSIYLSMCFYICLFSDCFFSKIK